MHARLYCRKVFSCAGQRHDTGDKRSEPVVSPLGPIDPLLTFVNGSFLVVQRIRKRKASPRHSSALSVPEASHRDSTSARTPSHSACRGRERAP
jgi:hypothetical protein